MTFTYTQTEITPEDLADHDAAIRRMRALLERNGVPGPAQEQLLAAVRALLEAGELGKEKGGGEG